MKKNFVEELSWREMIHDIIPGTKEQLHKETTSGYIGFDPTSDSLHIGNLVQIMTLVHFQKCGHKPIVLVGGATGMVGDPSGKSSERSLLSLELLHHNVECLKKQTSNFLDFSNNETGAELVNNFDWFKNFTFLEFLREVGKHLSVNYMLSKDSVKNRLETGLSFAEFSYQLVQGYDFYWLFKNKNCKLQMGGSDQWGNIVSGTELIRRKANEEAFAITTPLITKADGVKFGKSGTGNVWLDPQKTTPFEFYQYWLNVSDEDSIKLIKILTLMSKDEIDSLIVEHQSAPHKRILQKQLGKEITIMVHQKQAYDLAIKASNILFGDSTTEDLCSLDETTLLTVLDGVPQSDISRSSYDSVSTVVELLSETTKGVIFPSKGEARRKIIEGAVSINKMKVLDPLQEPKFNLLQDRYLLVQKGKKNYYLINVE